MKVTPNTATSGIAIGLILPMLLAGLILSIRRRTATLEARETSLAASPVSQRENLTARVTDSYGKLPLSFEANEGQFASCVQFVSRSAGNAMYLEPTEAILKLADSTQPKSPGRSREITASGPDALATAGSDGAVLRMKLVGANSAAKATGMDELPGKSNYFIGNDPKKWRVNVPTYAKVKYEQVYRGVDLVYYGNQRQLEYDLIVAPGANPAAIELAFEGANSLRLDERGDLIVSTPTGEILQHAPILYQDLEGEQRRVEGDYFLRGPDRIGFHIGQYDATRPLVIDPVLSYSTYLGGRDRDIGYGIAVDPAGNAYVVGETRSVDFPTANALYPTFSFFDGFVTKFNAAGSVLIYSTYLGGSGEENARSIAVDSTGNAYVTGFTQSSDFPAVNALQSSLHGVFDAFVFKLNSAGSALQYSTYLGGSAGDQGLGIAVDGAGNCYVSGATTSTDFPTANAAQPTSGGSIFGDAFVAKLNAAGSAFIYSTYLGGNGSEAAWSIATDFTGNAYVTGNTTSTNFPTVNALRPPFPGPCFKSNNGGKLWSPINNGFNSVEARALAVDRTNPTTVYAAGAEGKVFKSVDAGNSWATFDNGLPGGTFGVNALAIDPISSSTIYAGTTSVFKSVDGGANWQFSGAGMGNPGILCLAIDPLTPTTLYAGTAGVFKSTNAGTSWTKFSSGIPNDQISSIAIDPVNPSTLYAASSSRLYKTINGGISWNAIRFSGSSFNPLAIDPANPSTLYLGQAGGIFKSTNGGSSFSFISVNINNVVDSLVIDPLNPSIIYAGTFGAGMYKSVNLGTTWAPIDNGLYNYTIQAVAIDPAMTSTLYIGMNPDFEAFVTKLNPSGALAYSTYLGDGRGGIANAIAADKFGNAYVVGHGSIPLAHPLQFVGGSSAFVAELNSTGSALLFSTFFGGSQFDSANAVAVDDSGNIYVAGQTQSTNFPTVNPVQAVFGGVIDGFIFKLNPGGSGIAYSTYLGGSKSDIVYGIAVDSAGNAYVAGQTLSSNLPTTPGAFQSVNRGIVNAFVAKLGAFDVCLQDESTGNVLSVNTTTGNYQFVSCGGITVDGTGVISRRGCLLTLQANGPDRRLLARIDTCLNSGTASFQLLSQGTTFTILDRNTANNTCACPR